MTPRRAGRSQRPRSARGAFHRQRSRPAGTCHGDLGQVVGSRVRCRPATMTQLTGDHRGSVHTDPVLMASLPRMSVGRRVRRGWVADRPLRGRWVRRGGGRPAGTRVCRCSARVRRYSPGVTDQTWSTSSRAPLAPAAAAHAACSRWSTARRPHARRRRSRSSVDSWLTPPAASKASWSSSQRTWKYDENAETANRPPGRRRGTDARQHRRVRRQVLRIVAVGRAAQPERPLAQRDGGIERHGRRHGRRRPWSGRPSGATRSDRSRPLAPRRPRRPRGSAR